jgi:hypothetical protein
MGCAESYGKKILLRFFRLSRLKRLTGGQVNVPRLLIFEKENP